MFVPSTIHLRESLHGMRRIWFVLFLLLLTAACGGASSGPANDFNEGDFTLTSPSETIRPGFDDLIHVNATVNGVQGHFILDSGADAFLVSEQFARRARLPISGQTTISTIAGTSRVNLRRIETFSFANIVGVDIDAAEAPLEGMDGIIGVPVFRAAILELDYQAGTLRILDPAAHSLDTIQLEHGGEVLEAPNFTLDHVTLNGVRTGPMRIDTGAGGGFRVSQGVGDQLMVDERETLPVVSEAANGSVEGTAFIVERANLSGFSLANQFVVMQDQQLEVGLIGSLVLRQFFVVMDMGNNQILLRQDRELRFGLDSRGYDGFDYAEASEDLSALGSS